MAAKAYRSLPQTKNPEGETRKAGFEFEFAEVGLEASARLVCEVFGGEVTEESAFIHKVTGTEFGDFQIEIDFDLLKSKRYESFLGDLGLDRLDGDEAAWLEKQLLKLSSFVAPFEIVTPPIPCDRLEKLDELVSALRGARAEGTEASLLNAFGLHINPEVASREPAHLRDVLRAFLVLEPWLRKRVARDLSRRLSPYIDDFPRAYLKAVLEPEDEPSIAGLIDAYLAENPTRNRCLDMLPLFAELDEERVRAAIGDDTLVKARPTYHYRLPDCRLGEDDWSCARAWNSWAEVERLAADKERLEELCARYLKHLDRPWEWFLKEWADQVALELAADG